MRLTCVEASWFTSRLKARLDDDSYRELQNMITEQPDKGRVMPGCGGLRKVRFADPSRGQGTRGGVRFIYLYVPEAHRVDFIDVYGKDQKDDLTPGEKTQLAELAREVRKEAVEAFNRSGGKS